MICGIERDHMDAGKVLARRAGITRSVQGQFATNEIAMLAQQRAAPAVFYPGAAVHATTT